MADRNYIHLSGRATRPATMRYTKSGKGVTNFSIANNLYGDKTYFFECVAWDKGKYKLAEYTAQIEKGDLIDIEGQLIVEENDGKKYFKINVDNFINCSQYGNRNSNSNNSNNQSNNQSNNSNDNFEDDMDNVPF